MFDQAFRRFLVTAAVGVAAATSVGAWGQDPPTTPAPPNPADFPSPAEVPKVALVPTLRTHPIRRADKGYIDGLNGQAVFNEQWVKAEVLPRDKSGIWVLDFAYKPLRIQSVDIPGKGRRDVYYMYYQIVNRTGEARRFIPQFTLVTDTGKRYEDMVIPQAVKNIRNRECPELPGNLYGAVDIMGEIPASTKAGIDDAVFGVAVWEGVDREADKLSIYVRGLSDGFREDPAPDGGPKPVVRYKSLQIDFIRRGDKHDVHEREIIPGQPAFEWTYR